MAVRIVMIIVESAKTKLKSAPVGAAAFDGCGNGAGDECASGQDATWKAATIPHGHRRCLHRLDLYAIRCDQAFELEIHIETIVSRPLRSRLDRSGPIGTELFEIVDRRGEGYYLPGGHHRVRAPVRHPAATIAHGFKFRPSHRRLGDDVHRGRRRGHGRSSWRGARTPQGARPAEPAAVGRGRGRAAVAAELHEECFLARAGFRTATRGLLHRSKSRWRGEPPDVRVEQMRRAGAARGNRRRAAQAGGGPRPQGAAAAFDADTGRR